MIFDSEQVHVLHFPNLEIWLNARHPRKELEKMVHNIRKNVDYYFSEKIIKQDVSTTIAETAMGETAFIIKRINAQNIFTIIRRMCCVTRVEKNWKNAAILNRHGIDTFTPIALVKKKWFGFCYLSYLYMSKIEGMDAVGYLDSCSHKAQWQGVADKIIALIKKLNQLGLRHRDLNLSNIIIYQDTPYLIDLDSMRLDKKIKNKLAKKEIDRFINNIDYLKERNNELYNYFDQALSRE